MYSISPAATAPWQRKLLFTLACSNAVDHGKRHVVERFSSAGAAVVYAGNRFIEEVEQYFADVFHIDEITALFTVAVAETAFKELHFMITSVLEVLMEMQRSPYGLYVVRADRRR